MFRMRKDLRLAGAKLHLNLWSLMAEPVFICREDITSAEESLDARASPVSSFTE